MPKGCSNGIFENQIEVIQIYVKFTLCLQIQMKQVFSTLFIAWNVNYENLHVSVNRSACI